MTTQSPVQRSVRERLFGGLPIYTTKLVRESDVFYSDCPQMSGPAEVAELMRAFFEGADREQFVVLFLNTANNVVGLHVASEGGLASTIVEPRQVYKAAILANAAAIIVAHNHPSGNPEPSRDDIRITRKLVEAGKIVDIPLHDHLILAEHEYTSLAERDLL